MHIYRCSLNILKHHLPSSEHEVSLAGGDAPREVTYVKIRPWDQAMKLERALKL